MMLAKSDNAELDAIALRQDRKRRGFVLYRDLAAVSNKDWMVRGLLGSREASVFFGEPGCGKSALVEDMGLHISAGRPWHGRAVKQGAVLYIALERPTLIERRAIAFRIRHEIPDLPFAIMRGVLDFREARTATAITETVRQVEADTGQKVVLIIVDTISRALAGGDENDSKSMGAIVATTSRLQADTSAAVLWVHHVPVNSPERLRGHGALLGAVDTSVQVEKAHSELRTATVRKANDSEEGTQIAFNLESVVIGTDEDGLETTAPVVVEAEGEIPSSEKKTRRLSDRQRLALAALAEAALANGQTPPQSFDLPAGLKAVTLDQWRDELFKSNVLDRNAPNPRTDFRRLHDQLKSRGAIGSLNNLIWAAGT